MSDVIIHSRITHLLRDYGHKPICPFAGGELHGQIRHYSQSMDCE